MNKILSQNEQKELVGKYAINVLIERNLIFSGMKIGLGTGSTAMPAVKALAQKIADKTVQNIKAVATSFQTQIECEQLGIPVFSLNSKEIDGELDLAIDGADEISPQKWLIKGGGAALLLEKIVEYNAKKLVIIADESKDVPHVGTGFALPIEIIPQARVSIIKSLEKTGASCVLRMGVRKAGPVITDNGNMILDVLWKNPQNAVQLEIELNKIAGVVENGFFTAKTPLIFIAHSNGIIEEK